MLALVHHHFLHHRFHGPHLDYVGVAAAAFVSWIGLTGPGEAALIAAGVGAARGKVDLEGMIFVAWAGGTIGGTAGWLLGLKGGRTLLTREGPLRRARRRILRSGDRFYERWGALAVYFAPSWMAGINGMRGRRFVPINAIACAVWALLFGLGAYAAGPSVSNLLDDLGTLGLILLGVLALGLVVGNWLRKRRDAAVP